MLWFLADKHNEKKGAAWPSVTTIARYSSLSKRRVREIISALICRGVLERYERARPDGGTTSNYYQFPELGFERIAIATLTLDTGKLTHPAQPTVEDRNGEGRAAQAPLSVYRTEGCGQQPPNIQGTVTEVDLEAHSEQLPLPPSLTRGVWELHPVPEMFGRIFVYA